MRRTLQAAVILAGVGMLGIAGWSGATNWRPSTTTYALQGVDLDPDPVPVEWGTVRAGGADFAYLVATIGTGRRDTAFETNWAALPDAGLRRGAVHLYSLCAGGRDQANAFNTLVPRDADALPAAVDVDTRDDCAAMPDRAKLIADLRTFLRVVETHTGKPVLLRVSRRVERTYRLTAAIDRPVWVTGNAVAPGYAARPWRLWRASDIRRVDGVTGAVNWDVVAP